MKGIVIGFAAVLAVGATYAGCSSHERKFESVCQVVARRVVEKTTDGKPEIVDLELEWDPCPGDQFQVIRGDGKFAECTEKYEAGQYVPVRVKQWWDERGFYRWDVYQVGDCARAIDPEAEGSYEKSRECSDVVQHGRTTGFDCSKKPQKRLVSVCPWMARD